MKRPKFRPTRPTAQTTRRHSPQELAAIVGQLRSVVAARPGATAPTPTGESVEPIDAEDDSEWADEDEWEVEEEIEAAMQEAVVDPRQGEVDDLEEAEDDHLSPSDEGLEEFEGENGSDSRVDTPVEAFPAAEDEVGYQGRGPLTPREKLRWALPLLAADVAELLEIPEKTVRNAAKDRRLVRCGTLAQSSVFTWKAVLGWLGATDDER